MTDAGRNLRWTPEGSSPPARRELAQRLRGPRWLVSLRAIVAALAMMAAALGVLWWETAGVQGASAQLATAYAGKVTVPPLDGSVTPTAGSASVNLGMVEEPLPPTAGLPPLRLVVHVAGAVKSPGVFLLKPDTRVYQAVEAAGGALTTAELSALNLAAPLSDGLQIVVPTREQASAMALNPGAGIAVPAPGGQAVPGKRPQSAGMLNLNTASAAELETLPGVGPVLAERIVTWRTAHGPYPTVEALDAVNGIGAKLLAGLRDLVTV